MVESEPRATFRDVDASIRRRVRRTLRGVSEDPGGPGGEAPGGQAPAAPLEGPSPGRPDGGRRLILRDAYSRPPTSRRRYAARSRGRHLLWRTPDHTAGVLAASTAIVATAGLTFALLVSGVQGPGGPASVRSGAAGGATSAPRSSSQASAVAAPARPLKPVPDLRALQNVLSRRAAALLAGDRRGWLAPLVPGSTYAKDQAVLFDRLRRLPLTQWRFTVEGVLASGSSAAGTWVADVRVTYRMPGDSLDVSRRVPVTVGGGSSPQVLGEAAARSGAAPMRDLWEIADISVVRGSHSIIIGDSRRAPSLRRYAKITDTAVARVDAVWGTRWRRTVVVIVPNSAGDMARVLGRSGMTGLNQIAAVTTGEIDRPEGATTSVATADRVVLNPAAFDAFDARNRTIVLTHEMTHVATRSSVIVSPPLWLEEAFADYIGYRGMGASRNQIAGPFFVKVRAGKGPRHLPTAEAFDPTRGSVDDAYVGAWLALDMIDSRLGRAGVVTFYQTAAGLVGASSGSSMTSDAALARAYAELGTDAAGFERQWLAYTARRAR